MDDSAFKFPRPVVVERARKSQAVLQDVIRVEFGPQGAIVEMQEDHAEFATAGGGSMAAEYTAEEEHVLFSPVLDAVDSQSEAVSTNFSSLERSVAGREEEEAWAALQSARAAVVIPVGSAKNDAQQVNSAAVPSIVRSASNSMLSGPGESITGYRMEKGTSASLIRDGTIVNQAEPSITNTSILPDVVQMKQDELVRPWLQEVQQHQRKTRRPLDLTSTGSSTASGWGDERMHDFRSNVGLSTLSYPCKTFVRPRLTPWKHCPTGVQASSGGSPQQSKLRRRDHVMQDRPSTEASSSIVILSDDASLSLPLETSTNEHVSKAGSVITESVEELYHLAREPSDAHSEQNAFTYPDKQDDRETTPTPTDVVPKCDIDESNLGTLTTLDGAPGALTRFRSAISPSSRTLTVLTVVTAVAFLADSVPKVTREEAVDTMASPAGGDQVTVVAEPQAETVPGICEAEIPQAVPVQETVAEVNTIRDEGSSQPVPFETHTATILVEPYDATAVVNLPALLEPVPSATKSTRSLVIVTLLALVIVCVVRTAVRRLTASRHAALQYAHAKRKVRIRPSPVKPKPFAVPSVKVEPQERDFSDLSPRLASEPQKNQSIAQGSALPDRRRSLTPKRSATAVHHRLEADVKAALDTMKGESGSLLARQPVSRMNATKTQASDEANSVESNLLSNDKLIAVENKAHERRKASAVSKRSTRSRTPVHDASMDGVEIQENAPREVTPTRRSSRRLRTASPNEGDAIHQAEDMLVDASAAINGNISSSPHETEMPPAKHKRTRGSPERPHDSKSTPKQEQTRQKLASSGRRSNKASLTSEKASPVPRALRTSPRKADKGHIVYPSKEP